MLSRDQEGELNDNDTPDLGMCCICGVREHVTAIIMLDVKNQVPGHGWGCLGCGLPSDGASAVLCETCLPGWQSGKTPLRFACRGYPAEDGRVPIAELTVPHLHDPEVEH